MKNNFTTQYSIIYITLFMLLASSCAKESNTQNQYSIPSNLQMISSGYASGANTKVAIYAADSLFVGYNQLYIALFDSTTGQVIAHAQISLSTIMHIGTADSLSMPISTTSITNNSSGLFSAATVFTSATTINNKWTLTVNVQGLSSQKQGSFVFTGNVVQPSPAKAYSTTSLADNAGLFVALVQPFNPVYGANSFEMAIYRQINATNFVVDSTYTATLNATMPAMVGMNSPNNVNPIYSGNGIYTGSVNFLMTGNWQVNIDLFHNGSVADSSHYFTLTLQ